MVDKFSRILQVSKITCVSLQCVHCAIVEVKITLEHLQDHCKFRITVCSFQSQQMCAKYNTGSQVVQAKYGHKWFSRSHAGSSPFKGIV